MWSLKSVYIDTICFALLPLFTLSASFLILKQSFLSVKETNFVSFFIISQHRPPILWSPLWNFACKFFWGKGLSLIMCYTDLNTIDLQRA